MKKSWRNSDSKKKNICLSHPWFLKSIYRQLNHHCLDTHATYILTHIFFLPVLANFQKSKPTPPKPNTILVTGRLRCLQSQEKIWNSPFYTRRLNELRSLPASFFLILSSDCWLRARAAPCKDHVQTGAQTKNYLLHQLCNGTFGGTNRNAEIEIWILYRCMFSVSVLQGATCQPQSRK